MGKKKTIKPNPAYQKARLVKLLAVLESRVDCEGLEERKDRVRLQIEGI